MSEPRDDLDDLTAALEAAAARLREGDLDAEQAAALIDECSRTAARAAAELDRQAGALDAPPGQDSLL